MFNHHIFPHVFFTVIRVFIVPIVGIFMLSGTFMGLQIAFLAVNVVNSVLTVPLVVFHSFEMLPNLAFLRTHHIMKLLISITLEILGLVVFWVIYFSIFQQY